MIKMIFFKDLGEKVMIHKSDYYKKVKNDLDVSFENKVFLLTFFEQGLGQNSIKSVGFQLVIPIIKDTSIVLYGFKCYADMNSMNNAIRNGLPENNFHNIQKINSELKKVEHKFDSIDRLFNDFSSNGVGGIAIKVFDVDASCESLKDIYDMCLNKQTTNNEIEMGKLMMRQSGIETILDIKISKKSIENFKNIDLTNLIEKSPVDCQKAIIDLLINSKKTAKIKRNKI